MRVAVKIPVFVFFAMGCFFAGADNGWRGLACGIAFFGDGLWCGYRFVNGCGMRLSGTVVNGVVFRDVFTVNEKGGVMRFAVLSWGLSQTIYM